MDIITNWGEQIIRFLKGIVDGMITTAFQIGIDPVFLLLLAIFMSFVGLLVGIELHTRLIVPAPAAGPLSQHYGHKVEAVLGAVLNTLIIMPLMVAIVGVLMILVNDIVLEGLLPFHPSSDVLVVLRQIEIVAAVALAEAVLVVLLRLVSANRISGRLFWGSVRIFFQTALFLAAVIVSCVLYLSIH